VGWVFEAELADSVTACSAPEVISTHLLDKGYNLAVYYLHNSSGTISHMLRNETKIHVEV
jgi:hypothetical protein